MDTILSILEKVFNGTKIGYYVAGAVIVFTVYGAFLNLSLIAVKKSVAKHPTQQNAERFYTMLCMPFMSINNHPDDWNEYRNIFNRINNSERIKTDIKIKIKNKLIKKKLYLGRTPINDNYLKTNTYGIN